MPTTNRQPGDSLDRYVILEVLGGQGAETLYAAYDPLLQRRVGLKVVEPSGGSDHNLREARALAQVSHPNIVRIYDVGVSAAGQVFMAMERVAGETVNRWTVRQRPTWREILRVFLRAGEGVAALHAARLTHDHFDASSVLVGADGRVTITELGHGRAHARENIAAAALDDQRAFCRLLHDALSRSERVPVWLRQLVRRAAAEPYDSMPELLRALSRDPARGWKRAGVAVTVILALAGTAMGIRTWSAVRAQRCQGAAGELAGIWNDARAAEMRAAFGATELAYAADTWQRTTHALDTYAAAWRHQHIDSCQATTLRGEQPPAVMDLRMACLQRVKGQLAARVDLLLRADAAVVENAIQIVDSLPRLTRCVDIDALTAAVPPPEDPTVLGRVESTRRTLDAVWALVDAGKFAEAQPLAEKLNTQVVEIPYPPVRAEVGVAAGHVAVRLGHLNRADELLRAAFFTNLKSGAYAGAAEALVELAWSVGSEQSRLGDGLEWIGIAQSLAAGVDAGSMLAAQVERTRGGLLTAAGRYDEALAVLHSAVAVIARALDADQPEPYAIGLELAGARNDLAAVYGDLGRYDEARAEHERVLAMRLKMLGADHPSVAVTRNNLGLIYWQLGQYDDAEREYLLAIESDTKSLGPNHPDVAISHNNLGLIYWRVGRFNDAEREHRRALEILLATLGPEHPNVSAVQNSLGLVLERQGKLEEAEDVLRRALAVDLKSLGPHHPDVAYTYDNLGGTIGALGRYDQALALRRRALAIRLAALEPDHPDVAISYNNLGDIYRLHDHLREAESAYRRALAIRLDKLGLEHPKVAQTRHSLGVTLLACGRLEEAHDELTGALVIRGESLPPTHPLTLATALSLGEVKRKQGELDESLALARRAFDSLGNNEPHLRAQAAFLLAQLAWEREGDRVRARSLAEQAQEDFARAGRAYARRKQDVDRWLAAHP